MLHNVWKDDSDIMQLYLCIAQSSKNFLYANVIQLNFSFPWSLLFL